MEGSKCPICGSELLWDSDSDWEESGCSVPGILTFYHCEDCGAQIEIFMPEKEGE